MRKLSAALLLLLACLALGGCGGGESGSGSGNAVAASKGCITGGCHEVITSRVTGNAIGAEWGASSHKAMNVAGCRTCHGHSHQNSCSGCHGGAQVQNPQQNSLDASARCLDCHVSGPDLMNGLDYRHIPELNPSYRLNSGFNYYSAAGYVTMRGTAYESRCIWCHNPHDNRVLPQHKDWAESGHGNTNSGPFASRTRDFKTLGSWSDWSQAAGDGCVRCHTATGYINLVTSDMKNISPWGLQADGKTPISSTRQTLYCNVCHDNGNGKSYGYSLRQIPAFGLTGGVRIYQNYSASWGTTRITATTFTNATTNRTKTSIVPQVNPLDNNSAETFARIRILNNFIDFPNVGISARCVLCHSGRASGNLIKIVATSNDANGEAFNFRLNSRIGVHDFAGAGTMFRSLGFEFYSSYHYDQPAGIPYAHDQLGQNNFQGTGARGPCITCHMSSAESHSFGAVTFSNRTSASLATLANKYPVSRINTFLCTTCHSSGGIGSSQFNGTVSALNTKKTGYATALKALQAWVNMKGLGSNTNWLRSSSYTGGRNNGADGTALEAAGVSQTACVPPSDRSKDLYLGMRNMGASMNQNYLSNEPAAYVHNDLYMKRLIYDSLDWIDNCLMDKSAENAIKLTNNTSIFLGSADRLTSDQMSTAINYLIGAPGGGRPGGN